MPTDKEYALLLKHTLAATNKQRPKTTSDYLAEDNHSDMDTQANVISNTPDLSFLRSSNPAIQRAGLTSANILILQRTIGNRAVRSLIQRTKVNQTIQRVTKSRLYVGNLSFNTSRESIEATFAAAGGVREVAMPTDRETGQPRGFAFVTMDSSQAAENAISQLNGCMLDGRPLKVNEAQERQGSRSGGGGGRGSGGSNGY